MATQQIVEFNPVQFCESLFVEACKIAKLRLGQEPMPSQLQMGDLVTAFRNLRQIDYTNQFGLTAGEWNESLAIIKTYLLAANHKAPRILHPELGVVIGTVIEEWGRFEDIPKDLQAQVRKAKKGFQNTEDKFMDRLNHFFNEMKVRAASLPTPEKEGVVTLISLYQPQARFACHRGEVESVLHLLNQLEMDLNRLALQSKEPSRLVEQLVIKTRHDLSELDSFGNKGNKSKKKVSTR
jgi:BMFP domain-containing protein YqiC